MKIPKRISLGRFATKSEGEREDEEVERLVREAPKVKPPRHDKRRERVETDKDPDTDKKDPDLSMNYKTIGGSVRADLITVRLKEDPSKTVQVTPETLKTEPDKYEEIKDEEGPQPQKKDLGKIQQTLRSMADTDAVLNDILSDFTNPKSDSFQLAQGNPKLNATPFLRGRTLPKGITTVGDLQEALLYRPVAAPTSPGKPGKPEAPPSKKPSSGGPPPPEGPPAGQSPPESPPGPKSDGRPDRPVTKSEVYGAHIQIARTFPPEVAADLYSLQPSLHPDEVSRLVRDYSNIRGMQTDLKDIKDLRKSAVKFYATDPSQVPEPKMIEKEGEEVPFDSLDSEEQAKALRQHQVQTVAMSLAARSLIQENLEKKAGTPSDLADTLSNFLLSGRSDTPDERHKKAGTEAEALFYKGLEASGESKPLAKEVIKKTLNAIKDPAAQRLAVGYFQARDYNEARKHFLSSAFPKTAISEHQSPKVIASRMAKAMEFLRDRRNQYPQGMVQNVAATFKNRVMKHLGALVPSKAEAAQELLDQVDNRFYDEDLKAHEKAKKAYEEAKKKAEQEYESEFAAYSSKLRGSQAEPDPPLSTSERLAEAGIMEPVEPQKPIHYDSHHKSPGEQASSAKDLWDRFNRRLARSEGLAERVAAKSLFFTYPDTFAMDPNRKAVYWGVEPQKPEPYPEWTQPTARDLGEDDYTTILRSAKDWLQQPVLSKEIDGVYRDTQLRAALDLAIASGNYSRVVHPSVYNDLLARLAGKPTTETLTTITAAESAGGNKTARNEMPKKVEFDSATADRLLARLDRVASTIQDKHEEMGLKFEAARNLVNEIDRVSDELETAAYGEASMITRQAQVLQRESDEPYMDTFTNPHSPHQTEADEPYMSAYGNDDSSGVHHGKAENGRPLAP